MPTHANPSDKSSSSERNILDVLKQDHEKARYLFDKIIKSGKGASSDAHKLFRELDEELELHMVAEERVFYSALKGSKEARDKVLEGYEEHLAAMTFLGTFKGPAVDDERWMAKVKVLHEMIEHHLKEEEGEIFKLARKELDKNQMQEMAVNFMRHKREGRNPSRGTPAER